MGWLDWVRRKGEPEPERAPYRHRSDMPFRFEKPFAHLTYLMTDQEKKVVEGIDARWKADYEQFKNYPPMSESQEFESKVFRAVDDAYRALHVRGQAPYVEWKRLETGVDVAISAVQNAFNEQRRFVEHIMSSADRARDAFKPRTLTPQEPEDEPEPHPYFSKKRNPIITQLRSDWQSDDYGLNEYRHHIGRSIEGLHGGLEVSHIGGDCVVRWSNARPTPEAAEKASIGMRAAIDQGDRPPRSSEKLFAEWRRDAALAKQRDETGHEPAAAPLELPADSGPKNERQRHARRNDHEIPF